MSLQVLDKVKSILAKELNVDFQTISEDSTLSEDLGADSLDLAEIALAIKDEFGHDISDTEFQKIKTVGDINRMLNNAMAKDAA